MKLFQSIGKKRRGGIAPFAAILMLPLVGMAAFAIDIGYILRSQTQLQNTADASALAAAAALQPYYVNYYASATPTQQAVVLGDAQTAARNAAQKYANANVAGNAYGVQVDTTNDVKFGYLWPDGVKYDQPPDTGYFPNTVAVTLKMDGGENTNSKLTLFFGRLFGMNNTNVNAYARATIYNGNPSDIPDSVLGGVLPITTDIQGWNSFVATGIPTIKDGNYNVTLPTITVSNQSSIPGAVPGGPALTLLPDSSGLANGGHEHYIDIGPFTNSNSVLKNWFANGASPRDISFLRTPASPGIPAQVPLPPVDTSTGTMNYLWKGIPGYRVNSEPLPVIGTTQVIPLFAHVNPASTGGKYVADSGAQYATWSQANGQSMWYNIVGWAPVLIVDGNQLPGGGSTIGGGTLSVQPTTVTLPNSFIPGATPAPKPAAGTVPSAFFVGARLSG